MMLASLSWAARLLVAGGLVALLSALVGRWGRAAVAGRWLWRAALALGMIGCWLIPAVNGRGPLAQPALALAVAVVGAGGWASVSAREAVTPRLALLTGVVMVVPMLERAVWVPVAAGGWWFGVAELLALWAVGVLLAETLWSQSESAKRGLCVALVLQGAGVLLAWVGARAWWGMEGLLEPVLAARAVALLGMALGATWLGGAGAVRSRVWERGVLTAVLLVVVWGCVHGWTLALGSAPTLYLWR